MTNFRKNRVADLVREVVSDIIRDDIKDPRVQGVTITEVKMSADLKLARIYFSCLADGNMCLKLLLHMIHHSIIRKKLTPF